MEKGTIEETKNPNPKNTDNSNSVNKLLIIKAITIVGKVATKRKKADTNVIEETIDNTVDVVAENLEEKIPEENIENEEN